MTSRPYRSAMWCGCHGVPPFRRCAIERPGHLDPDQHGGDRERRPDRQVDDREHDPERLRDRDRPDVDHRHRPPLRVVARRARPEEDHRHAHHDVARDHHAVVEDVAVVDRRERLLEPEREHDHAEHLHHRREAHDPVVGVVGRREPRVVDPRPGDGERREREAEDPRPDVVLRDVVRELVRRDPERDDERQVEEQLERRRGAVRLVRIAPGQAAAVVRAGCSRCRDTPRMLPRSGDFDSRQRAPAAPSTSTAHQRDGVVVGAVPARGSASATSGTRARGRSPRASGAPRARAGRGRPSGRPGSRAGSRRSRASRRWTIGTSGSSRRRLVVHRLGARVERVELAQRGLGALAPGPRSPPRRRGPAAGSPRASATSRRRTAPPRRGSGGRRSSGARRRARRSALIDVRAGPSSSCSATALSVIRRRVCSSSSARRFIR